MTTVRLTWYLELERKINDLQFDFRLQRSTIDAILILGIKMNGNTYQEMCIHSGISMQEMDQRGRVEQSRVKQT